MMKNILLVLTFFLSSCAVFRKSSKTVDSTTQSTQNQLESNQLVLKRADKETQVFTYWNDSGFYQYQLIKEQYDDAALAQLNMEDKQVFKEKKSSKQSEPMKMWGYVALLLILSGCFFMIKRFKF